MGQAWSRRTALSAAATGAAATAMTITGGSASAAPAPQAPATPRRAPSANGRLYELRSGRHRVTIAGVAATVLSWRVDGQEMLLTHSAYDIGEGYQGKTILPWANRIDAGKYTFDDQELQVPINEPDRNTALHGLMAFVEWEPVRLRHDSVVLEYRLPPHYGYPFQLVFRTEYTVDDDGFTTRLAAYNVGPTAAPFGTANHTYIAAARGSIDAMTLLLPADTYYTTDDRLLPTGKEPVQGTEFDFREQRDIGETVMDTAFTDLARGSDGTAVIRFGRPGGENVELWLDEAHPYLQVYTDDAPEADRPKRSGLTVEPMTLAPNAFVSGDGLVTIPTGEAWKGSWGYRVTG